MHRIARPKKLLQVRTGLLGASKWNGTAQKVGLQFPAKGIIIIVTDDAFRMEDGRRFDDFDTAVRNERSPPGVDCCLDH